MSRKLAKRWEETLLPPLVLKLPMIGCYSCVCGQWTFTSSWRNRYYIQPSPAHQSQWYCVLSLRVPCAKFSSLLPFIFAYTSWVSNCTRQSNNHFMAEMGNGAPPRTVDKLEKKERHPHEDKVNRLDGLSACPLLLLLHLHARACQAYNRQWHQEIRSQMSSLTGLNKFTETLRGGGKKFN